MADEVNVKYLENENNSIRGLMEAAARAEKLGEVARLESEASTQTAQGLSWIKEVEEAIKKVREISNNIRKTTEVASGTEEKETTSDGQIKTNNNVTSVLLNESEQTVRQAEEIEKTAKNVAEISLRALRVNQGQVLEKTEIARKAAETAKNLAAVAFNASEISTKVSQEAINASVEASKEAISKAEEISRLAKDAAETSIQAAAEVNKVSTQAFREAAEISIKAFKELESQAVAADIQSIANAETSMKIIETPIKSEKTTGDSENNIEPSRTVDVVEIQDKNIEENNLKKEYENKDNIGLRDIESRLDLLNRMYKIQSTSKKEVDASLSP